MQLVAHELLALAVQRRRLVDHVAHVSAHLPHRPECATAVPPGSNSPRSTAACASRARCMRRPMWTTYRPRTAAQQLAMEPMGRGRQWAGAAGGSAQPRLPEERAGLLHMLRDRLALAVLVAQPLNV